VILCSNTICYSPTTKYSYAYRYRYARSIDQLTEKLFQVWNGRWNLNFLQRFLKIPLLAHVSKLSKNIREKFQISKTFFSCFKSFNQTIWHQTSVIIPRGVIESLDMLWARCCRVQKTQKSTFSICWPQWGSDQVNGCQKLVLSPVNHVLFSFFKPGEGFVSYRKLPRKPESCIDRLEDAIHNMSDTEAQKQLTGIA
jgi:hypothetical protein